MGAPSVLLRPELDARGRQTVPVLCQPRVRAVVDETSLWDVRLGAGSGVGPSRRAADSHRHQGQGTGHRAHARRVEPELSQGRSHGGGVVGGCRGCVRGQLGAALVLEMRCGDDLTTGSAWTSRCVAAHRCTNKNAPPPGLEVPPPFEVEVRGRCTSRQRRPEPAGGGGRLVLPLLRAGVWPGFGPDPPAGQLRRHGHHRSARPGLPCVLGSFGRQARAGLGWTERAHRRGTTDGIGLAKQQDERAPFRAVVPPHHLTFAIARGAALAEPRPIAGVWSGASPPCVRLS